MRVLHVITGLAPGGAEQQLLELTTRTEHDAEVVALYNAGAVGEQMQAAGVRVHDLGMHSNRDVGALRRLVSLMRKGRFDVVHVHLYRACVYGRIAAAMARVPIIVTSEHSLGETLFEGREITRSIHWLYRATDIPSDLTIAVSSAVGDRLEAWGIPSRKITVIPNGVDTMAFRFDESCRATVRSELAIAWDATVFGSIGRLVPSKGYDLVVEALAPQLRDGATLVLAGAGSSHDLLVGIARRLGVESSVRFLGERTDIAALLAAFDVFVSASAPGEETFGLSSVEAIASGLPLVTTYCPALEGVDDPRIVRCDRTVAAVATATRSVLGDSNRPRSAPDAVLAPFRIEQVVREIDGCYEGLSCQEQGRRAGTIGPERRAPRRGEEAVDGHHYR